MGWVHTSSAPASRSTFAAWPISSPVMSSRLQLSSAAESVLSAVSPSIARTQLVHAKSLVPMPQPVLRSVITGMLPKASAKWRSSAAPVGVHSSPRIAPP